MKRAAIWLILIASFCGLSNSFYLAKSVSGGAPLICESEGSSGCNTIAHSPYSRLYGVPVADLGVVFYAIVFVLAAIELMYRKVYARRAIQTLAALGVVASAYFIFLQTSVINAFCIYCMTSALISFLIFMLAYFIEPFSRERAIVPSRSLRTTLQIPPPV